ncbi:MAG TPA: hypothetical protein PLU72_10715 [Candidatus Ozemobacteraceae bacterium]|nr:hypothetical protein [Candidatus Ozemobacteraceae bacterium]
MPQNDRHPSRTPTRNAGTTATPTSAPIAAVHPAPRSPAKTATVPTVAVSPIREHRNAVAGTLVSLAGFLVNLYIIFKIYGGTIDDPERSLVFIVFLTTLLVSLHQRDPGWFFGGLAVFYVPLIALKAGIAIPTLVSAGAAFVAAAAMGWIPTHRLFTVAGAAGQNLGAVVDRSRVVKRLLQAAGGKSGGESLTDADLSEFTKVEADAARVRGFFNGSDPSLEKMLGGTAEQIDGLLGDHARLLLRSAHLCSVIAQTDLPGLERERDDLEKEAASATDEVVRAQLNEAVEMKRQRIAELGKLDVCRQRIKVQRLQIIETIRGTFDRLNALKFSDIQTLQSSSDAIYAGIKNVRQDLAALESGMQEAELFSRGDQQP